MIQHKYCEFTLYYIYNFKILVLYFHFRAYKIVLIWGEAFSLDKATEFPNLEVESSFLWFEYS